MIKQWKIWEKVNNARNYKDGWVGKPSFYKRFSKTFVTIYENKQILTFDIPIYVGFSISDLSRLLIYEFDNFIKAKYGCGAKLLFGDTDSLVYKIKADDLREDFYEGRSLFGFSGYPEDSRFCDIV